MGWIRIKNGKKRLMLHSSMECIVCFFEDKTIKLLETERLFDIMKDFGKKISLAEFNERKTWNGGNLTERISPKTFK